MRMTRTLLFAAAGLFAFATATSAFAQSATGTAAGAQQKAEDDTKTEDKPKKAVVGETAPAFELKDANGKTHKLSDYKDKTVILQWINPQCPVCKGRHEEGPRGENGERPPRPSTPPSCTS